MPSREHMRFLPAPWAHQAIRRRLYPGCSAWLLNLGIAAVFLALENTGVGEVYRLPATALVYKRYFVLMKLLPDILYAYIETLLADMIYLLCLL